MAINRLLDTKRLLPLPQDLWGSLCSDCGKSQANWQWMGNVTASDGSTVGTATCALCYLYNSEWGKAQGGAMANLLRELEDGWNCKLERTEEDKLKSIGDANRVLATLAYLSHTMQVPGPRS
jgi:hypothetical protein